MINIVSYKDNDNVFNPGGGGLYMGGLYLEVYSIIYCTSFKNLHCSQAHAVPTLHGSIEDTYLKWGSMQQVGG